MLRVSTVSVMAGVCLVLGGYTFLLHHKLPRVNRGGFSIAQQDAQKPTAQADDVQQLQGAIAEQAAVLKNVSGLAQEVAELAQLLTGHSSAQNTATSRAEDLEGNSSPLPTPDPYRPFARRDMAPRPTKEPDLPEAPDYFATPVVPIEIDPAKELSEAECAERREMVKDAMQHAWNNYVKYAWGFDELKPRSLKGKDTFGGLGATILDSLDTLWLMGMHQEYQQARDWVATELNFTKPSEASVFETTIRVVGGMLSAYELTQDSMYVERCEELVSRLLAAYSTPTGIPCNTILLDTLEIRTPLWTKHSSTLSEFGSEQLEFVKLSHFTGNATYGQKAERVVQLLHRNHPDKGLMPLYLDPNTFHFTTTKLSLGALGDSYYEYLLKLWIMRGRSAEDELYRSMWETAMDEMIERLVFTSSHENLTYVADFDRKRVKHKMDHLVCFVPAMLALGCHMGAVTGAKADTYMQLAKNLTETCWQMYHTHPTGLAAEYVTFHEGRGMRSGVHAYLLRPEAVEAFFVMWRLTGQTKYREYGWGVFRAIQQWCKVQNGYVGVKDVRKAPPKHDDTQQSFFLAETLKYLYLMFGSAEEFSLDEWVFNTEAHPIRIMKEGTYTRYKVLEEDETPILGLKKEETDMQGRPAPTVVADAVDASLADAVADEDRANLNALHNTLDETAAEKDALATAQERTE